MKERNSAFSMVTTGKEFCTNNNLGKTCCLGGWVRSIREVGGMAFVDITDGTTDGTVQLTMTKDLFLSDCKPKGIGVGASIMVEGIEVPSRGHKKELKVEKCLFIGAVDPETYPMQKKSHSVEFLRKMAHFRPRTKLCGAINRMRNRLYMELHRFFQSRDFLFVPAPILTTNDCEGGGDMLQVTHPQEEHYFNVPVFLTVSGQLHIEPYACAHSRVYSFGPTFRGEKSQTGRHLSEFWMLEPEIAFTDMYGLIELISDMWMEVVGNFIEESNGDYDDIESICGDGARDRALSWIAKRPVVIPYDEAIDILQQADTVFEFEPLWDAGLQTEHERFLTEHVFHGPVIVRNYPRMCKAFYMKVDESGKTVSAFDLLVPYVGEIIGGSEREASYDMLCESMRLHKIEEADYEWYLSLRQHGSVPHAGFGLGFERLLRGLTGIDNIKDVVPFARSYQEISF